MKIYVVSEQGHDTEGYFCRPCVAFYTLEQAEAYTKGDVLRFDTSVVCLK